MSSLFNMSLLRICERCPTLIIRGRSSLCLNCREVKRKNYYRDHREVILKQVKDYQANHPAEPRFCERCFMVHQRRSALCHRCYYKEYKASKMARLHPVAPIDMPD
jgi:hypothetical protein